VRARVAGEDRGEDHGRDPAQRPPAEHRIV